jgi:hypothetical protein
MNHHPLMATMVTRDLNQHEADVGHPGAIGQETSRWESCATVDQQDGYFPSIDQEAAIRTNLAPMPHS